MNLQSHLFAGALKHAAWANGLLSTSFWKGWNQIPRIRQEQKRGEGQPLFKILYSKKQSHYLRCHDNYGFLQPIQSRPSRNWGRTSEVFLATKRTQWLGSLGQSLWEKGGHDFGWFSPPTADLQLNLKLFQGGSHGIWGFSEKVRQSCSVDENPVCPLKSPSQGLESKPWTLWIDPHMFRNVQSQLLSWVHGQMLLVAALIVT